MGSWRQDGWRQRGRLVVIAAASFVLLVLVLPQVATGIGLGRLAARITTSGACGSESGSSGSGSMGSGSGSSGNCGPPAITVSPDTKLADTQSVAVMGTGFPPGSEISMAECKAGATGQNGCDLGTVETAGTNSNGYFSTNYAVSRIIETTEANGTTESTDCAVSMCILGAATSFDLAVGAVARISFNPRIPPAFTVALNPIDTVNPTTGEADVTGTFVCRGHLTVQIFLGLDQHRGRFNVQSQAFGSTRCKGHTKWTVDVPPGYLVNFGPGKGVVSASFFTVIGNDQRDVGISGKVKLENAASK
jgi:hypothetical protein